LRTNYCSFPHHRHNTVHRILVLLLQQEQDYRPVTTDWSKHIAENVAKGSSLCPLGQSVMGGAFVKGEEGAELEDRVLVDGRVVPPTPAQQALNMAGLDIYSWDPATPHSDEEALSDLE